MKKLLLFSIILALSLQSCQFIFKKHLLGTKPQREEVTQKFNERIKLVQETDSSINLIVNQELTTWEREGFEFLYAYMPLSDLAMHNGNYVFSQVQSALEAKSYFKWGKKIPTDIFLHFVLPYRVNNEYTDNARQVFLDELKDRVKGLSMHDAALEVNHWCHEKVTYKPTDERTSGPLTTVRTAFGRCGEESTLTVAALRSVSIPARQVYTPRWAHTDDNHAWVEVWVDGKWHFMGACEPEPELDMAWFAGPVKRAMMARTFVFGKYKGKEEKLDESEWFTEINLLPNYAPTKKLEVKVVNEDGTPAQEANVEFQLYNYAEFYPIAKLKTDKNGKCSLTTGFGDLLVWASKDNTTGFAEADKELTETLTVTLSSSTSFADASYTLSPPEEQVMQQIDQSKAEMNNQRLKMEDEIRSKYISSFIDSSEAVKLAAEKGISADETWRFMKLSRGNWKEIYNFINSFDKEKLSMGLALLNTISEKDLHDITANTLNDHIATVDLYPALLKTSDFETFDKYVLSPRIGREFISPWRSFLQTSFTYDEIGFTRNNPYNLAKWITDNISIDKESNYYKVPLSPESVFKLKIADAYSRDIFFVATCRSFGVPARLEPATKRPQFLSRGKWNDVIFDNILMNESEKGTLKLSLGDVKSITNPKYFTHFTISKLDCNRFVTLDFENDQTINNFPSEIKLEAGKYKLITGSRQSDGTVLCKVKYFDVNANECTQVVIDFAASETKQFQVLGTINTTTMIPDITGHYSKPLIDFIHENGAVFAIIDPAKEPTKHLMNDISAVKAELEAIGANLFFAVAFDKFTPDFTPSSFSNLPKGSAFGIDKDQLLAKAIAASCGKTISTSYPIVTVINPNGEIVFYSEGYSIGLGEQIIRTLKK